MKTLEKFTPLATLLLAALTLIVSLGAAAGVSGVNHRMDLNEAHSNCLDVKYFDNDSDSTDLEHASEQCDELADANEGKFLDEYKD